MCMIYDNDNNVTCLMQYCEYQYCEYCNNSSTAIPTGDDSICLCCCPCCVPCILAFDIINSPFYILYKITQYCKESELDDSTLQKDTSYSI
jgi:hypothetical protein